MELGKIYPALIGKIQVYTIALLNSLLSFAD